MSKDLATAFLCGFHERDEEVKSLRARVKELEAVVDPCRDCSSLEARLAKAEVVMRAAQSLLSTAHMVYITPSVRDKLDKLNALVASYRS